MSLNSIFLIKSPLWGKKNKTYQQICIQRSTYLWTLCTALLQREHLGVDTIVWQPRRSNILLEYQKLLLNQNLPISIRHSEKKRKQIFYMLFAVWRSKLFSPCLWVSFVVWDLCVIHSGCDKMLSRRATDTWKLFTKKNTHCCCECTGIIF